MSELEMKAELERLRAENAQLKNKNTGAGTTVRDRGSHPASLYKKGWQTDCSLEDHS
jgi:hypothetical protein